MVKVILVPVLLVVACLACSQTPEEGELARLKEDLRTAVQRYQQAGRAAGIGGVDSTADADSAREAIERVEREVKRIKESASSDAVKEQAGRLLETIRAAREELGLR